MQLLLEGIPILRVSILLGHSSVTVTQRYYSPWVQARQAQLEAAGANVGKIEFCGRRCFVATLRRWTGGPSE